MEAAMQTLLTDLTISMTDFKKNPLRRVF